MERHGFLFDKKESPFSEFVREIYEERLEAKKSGDLVMSSLHKMTMNSLYGRHQTATSQRSVCDREKLELLMSIYQFGEVQQVNQTHYIITSALQRMKGIPRMFPKSMLRWKRLINNQSSSAVQPFGVTRSPSLAISAT